MDNIIRSTCAAILICVSIQVSANGPALFERSKPAVGKLRIQGELFSGDVESFSGSAFLVSLDGDLLTSSHVVPNLEYFKSISISATFGEKDYQVALSKRSDSHDVALLRVVGADLPSASLRLADSRETQTGSELYVLGFPFDDKLTLGKGYLSNKDQLPWRADLPLSPGSSGGPVLNMEGDVIAIAGSAIVAIDNGQGEKIPITGQSHIVPTHEFLGDLGLMLSTEQMSERALPETFSRSFVVAETNDDHKGVTDTSKRYHHRFEAEPCYRIEDAELERLSVNNERDVALNVESGGRAATLTYRLQAGPVFDRWRGWMKANVHLNQVYDQSRCMHAPIHKDG